MVVDLNNANNAHMDHKHAHAQMGQLNPNQGQIVVVNGGHGQLHNLPQHAVNIAHGVNGVRAQAFQQLGQVPVMNVQLGGRINDGVPPPPPPPPDDDVNGVPPPPPPEVNRTDFRMNPINNPNQHSVVLTPINREVKEVIDQMPDAAALKTEIDKQKDADKSTWKTKLITAAKIFIVIAAFATIIAVTVITAGIGGLVAGAMGAAAYGLFGVPVVASVIMWLGIMSLATDQQKTQHLKELDDKLGSVGAKNNYLQHVADRLSNYKVMPGGKPNAEKLKKLKEKFPEFLVDKKTMDHINSHEKRQKMEALRKRINELKKDIEDIQKDNRSQRLDPNTGTRSKNEDLKFNQEELRRAVADDMAEEEKLFEDLDLTPTYVGEAGRQAEIDRRVKEGIAQPNTPRIGEVPPGGGGGGGGTNFVLNPV